MVKRPPHQIDNEKVVADPKCYHPVDNDHHKDLIVLTEFKKGTQGKKRPNFFSMWRKVDNV